MYNYYLYQYVGLLSAVDNLNATVLDSTISLTWIPPFSLDIPGVHPDITYCIDVINSTSSQLILSQCEIGVSQYNYPRPLSLENKACDVFIFIVTPVNVVGNGTGSSISEKYSNESEWLNNMSSTAC